MKSPWLICSLLVLAGTALAQTNASFHLLEEQSPPPANTLQFSKRATNLSSLRKQALALYKTEQYKAARELFAKIVKEDVTDSDSLLMLAYCYYEMTNYSAAAPLFERYVILNPRIAEGHQYLGSCFSRLHRFKDAERELNTAIRLRPRYAAAYDQLGYLFECRNNDAKAAAAFEKAIRFGGETRYRCSEAGTCYAYARNYRRAVPLLEHAISLDPTNLFTAQWLGFSQCHIGEYRKAVATFTKALRIDPRDFFSQHWLGHTYFCLEKYDLAADAFAKAAVLKPRDPENIESRAFALMKGHHLGDAIKLLERCLSENPKSRTIREALLAAYLRNNDYRRASHLYPVLFPALGVLLGIGFVAGSFALLRKSFVSSVGEFPHLAFSLSWLVLYFESQLALVFFAGLFTSSKLVAGALLAPVPVLVAAIFAFPKQHWGQAFKLRLGSWKQAALAFLGWVAVGLISAGYSSAMVSIRHSYTQPRNIRFVFDLVEERRALAAVIVILLAPITEEVLFRGLLYGSISKWLKPLWTILITAAVFAAVHCDVNYFLPLFLIGVLLGWARHATNAIWLPACIHIFQNAIAFSVWIGRWPGG